MESVTCGGTCSAQILVRQIEKTLIVGVTVNRCHKTMFDTEGVIEHFRHGSEAVRRAGSIGDHMHRFRIVVGVVDADDERSIDCVFSRSRNDHFLRARLEVQTCILTLHELARALQHDVHLHGLVRQNGRILLRGQDDLAMLRYQLAVLEVRLGIEDAVGGVELEHVRQRGAVSEVIDRDHFEIREFLNDDSESLTSDAAEAVDGDVHGLCR